MDQKEHLSRLLPDTLELLDKDNKEKIREIKRERFITYPKASAILQTLESLLDHPDKYRMPNLLLVAESNNGKTSLLRKFWRTHPPTDGINQAAFPVVFILAPPTPDLNWLYNSILSYLLVPFKHSDPPSKKEAQIVDYFAKVGTRMLIIDEIQHVLGGSALKQRAFLNGLKNIGTSLKIPIVLSGTRDALMATTTDTQTSSRFQSVFLPVWQLDQDFGRFLASLERTLPLKKSSILASETLAPRIHDESEGYLGEIVEVVSKAAEYAILSGTERITLKEIRDCGYIRPSKRRAFDEIAKS